MRGFTTFFNENAASEHHTKILDINAHISAKALEPFITSYIALGGIVCKLSGFTAW